MARSGCHRAALPWHLRARPMLHRIVQTEARDVVSHNPWINPATRTNRRRQNSRNINIALLSSLHLRWHETCPLSNVWVRLWRLPVGFRQLCHVFHIKTHRSKLPFIDEKHRSLLENIRPAKLSRTQWTKNPPRSQPNSPSLVSSRVLQHPETDRGIGPSCLHSQYLQPSTPKDKSPKAADAAISDHPSACTQPKTQVPAPAPRSAASRSQQLTRQKAPTNREAAGRIPPQPAFQPDPPPPRSVLQLPLEPQPQSP